MSALFALLDDIAAIAKAAAASLDDIAAQTATAGKSAAGVVIDDAAVTPRYVTGHAANRELPIVARIAWGSIKNKLLYLLPGALALSYFAPWAITPILMLGGIYLCFEGYEKLHHYLVPHPDPMSVKPLEDAPTADAKAREDAQVAGAIRTDFILSAEIMAIALASITIPDFVTRAVILALVGLLVTAGVYGAVALIVKADDIGYAMAKNGRLAATRALGRGLVKAMPPLLKLLSFVGMLAMLWVGGGIILHGLEEFGYVALPHAIHEFAAIAGGGILSWLTEASGAGIIGAAIGWAVAIIVGLFKPVAAH